MNYEAVEQAVRDLKKGMLVLVVDDEDRENEGDLICHNRKCQLYGQQGKMPDLHANEKGTGTEALPFSDGRR